MADGGTDEGHPPSHADPLTGAGENERSRARKRSLFGRGDLGSQPPSGAHAEVSENEPAGELSPAEARREAARARTQARRAAAEARRKAAQEAREAAMAKRSALDEGSSSEATGHEPTAEDLSVALTSELGLDDDLPQTAEPDAPAAERFAAEPASQDESSAQIAGEDDAPAWARAMRDRMKQQFGEGFVDHESPPGESVAFESAPAESQEKSPITLSSDPRPLTFDAPGDETSSFAEKLAAAKAAAHARVQVAKAEAQRLFDQAAQERKVEAERLEAELHNRREAHEHRLAELAAKEREAEESVAAKLAEADQAVAERLANAESEAARITREAQTEAERIIAEAETAANQAAAQRIREAEKAALEWVAAAEAEAERVAAAGLLQSAKDDPAPTLPEPESASPPRGDAEERVGWKFTAKKAPVPTAGELVADDDVLVAVPESPERSVGRETVQPQDTTLNMTARDEPFGALRISGSVKTPKPPKERGPRAAWRAPVAVVVATVGLILASILAVAALLVALGTGEPNGLAGLLLDGARIVGGPFRALASSGDTDQAMLINWAIGAVVYLALSGFVSTRIRG